MTLVPQESILLTEDSRLLPMPFPCHAPPPGHLGTHPSFHNPRLTTLSPQAPTFVLGSPYSSMLSQLLHLSVPSPHYGTMRASPIPDLNEHPANVLLNE